jgi:glycosyltransferase involved in cell wall biosynthesis
MHTVALVLAALSGMGIVWRGATLVREHRSLLRLEEVPMPTMSLPVVTVVIPARDEERHLEEALTSVLAQRYEALEIIVIDDRSTDGTGPLLDRLARKSPRLRVVHIRELPAGWLGKNHALDQGAALARGEFLLFTDADVVMDPTVLARAVSHVVGEGGDHLALVPEVRMPGLLLRSVTGVLAVFFSLFLRPGKVRDPRSRRFVGIGAFNLVRTSAYRAAGGHRAIALRPDDDLKLGKLLKRAGARQELGDGSRLIHVEWYHSWRELINGVMKGAFAALDYRVSAVLVVTLLICAVLLWPFVALFVTSGLLWRINVFLVLAILTACTLVRPRVGVPVGFAVTFPLAAGFLIYLAWRSMVLTLRQRGIVWRGTHYDLRDLRANRV